MRQTIGAWRRRGQPGPVALLEFENDDVICCFCAKYPFSLQLLTVASWLTNSQCRFRCSGSRRYCSCSPCSRRSRSTPTEKYKHFEIYVKAKTIGRVRVHQAVYVREITYDGSRACVNWQSFLCHNIVYVCFDSGNHERRGNQNRYMHMYWQKWQKLEQSLLAYLNLHLVPGHCRGTSDAVLLLDARLHAVFNLWAHLIQQHSFNFCGRRCMLLESYSMYMYLLYAYIMYAYFA